MQYLQSVVAGGEVALGVSMLLGLLYSAAYLLCFRSWPCSGCSRSLELNDHKLDCGVVFECEQCGAINVMRPRASLVGWIILTAIFAFDFWAWFKLVQFRWVYKARFINWAFPSVVDKTVKPADFDGWFAIWTVGASLWALSRIFLTERDPGRDKRLKL